MSDDAKKLKDEGNAFFAKKQYLEAYARYSEGILLDANNAILYANRAACRIAMNQYMDAMEDARKLVSRQATEIDPKYPKAWYRLASALEGMGQHGPSVSMYEKTLEVLSQLPSPSMQLTKDCEVNLSRARRAAVPQTNMPANAVEVQIDSGLLPWQAAQKILSDTKHVVRSSAWSIFFANKDFTNASEKMNEMKRADTSNGLRTVQARLGSLQDITNAILRDSRVFRVQESDFLPRLNDQISFERNHWNGWSPETGPEMLQEKAIERLKKEGWDGLRPALTHNIRHWVIVGFITARLGGNYAFVVECHRNALSMINWGQQVWKNVPQAKRGVWNMYLNSLTGASYRDKNNLELLETIYEEADAILQDLEKNPYHPKDYDDPNPGFVLSFFDNIKGNALACKALYHNMIGEVGKDRTANTVGEHYISAMELYILAAACLPEDDENHPWYLNCAYNFMEIANVQPSLVMDILERIRISVPKMRKIWCQNPQLTKKDREEVYAKLLRIEKCAKSLIAQKMMTFEGPFDWPQVKSL
ncbi:hypothetical protein J3R30DRAFT_3703667 [Lentinula aciculospora]|uniref:TPR-like protein n=1 Tax=Lentinula aciculospora TaxID=153920 RepID=A0A9W9DMY9_9AGAR|nr:hypothetical protein J3R30DRAFT_3703667 [Lentinula aciculospora]